MMDNYHKFGGFPEAEESEEYKRLKGVEYVKKGEKLGYFTRRKGNATDLAV